MPTEPTATHTQTPSSQPSRRRLVVLLDKENGRERLRREIRAETRERQESSSLSHKTRRDAYLLPKWIETKDERGKKWERYRYLAKPILPNCFVPIGWGKRDKKCVLEEAGGWWQWGMGGGGGGTCQYSPGMRPVRQQEELGREQAQRGESPPWGGGGGGWAVAVGWSSTKQVPLPLPLPLPRVWRTGALGGGSSTACPGRTRGTCLLTITCSSLAPGRANTEGSYSVWSRPGFSPPPRNCQYVWVGVRLCLGNSVLCQTGQRQNEPPQDIISGFGSRSFSPTDRAGFFFIVWILSR